MSSQRIARDPWLDNAKMALVTLVVIGHVWALLPAEGLVGDAYDFLYAWHMPAFVFVTGYLSRTFDYSPERLWNLVRTVAVPYVVFECLMALFRLYLGGEHLNDLFTDPHWPLWFLTALIFWRLATPVFRAVPVVPALLAAVVLSLLSGTVDGENAELFDLTRVLGMIPFFVLGVHTTKERLELLRAPGLRWVAVVTFGGLWLLTTSVGDLAGTHWLYYATPYADLGASDTRGAVTRLVLLVVGLVGTMAFLALVPRIGGWFARMGGATLVVYLCHGFVVRGLEYGGYTEWATRNPAVAPATTVLVGLALALVLAAPPVARRLQVLVDPFGRAEQQVKEAVELTAVAQDTGSLRGMRTQVLAR
ncbi:acyltransferase family protein [Nocardioides stalactiti]|uniref:acyltransferase family protein n=1 Tax=Nocardioides stalactiti TaxID=2755356 RepID=UPI0015FFEB11|nr:acyltransferase family protein [Nocardioides stalactiti]